MSKVTNLVILTTHPIQYYAPVFRLLAENKDINLTVLYSWGKNSIKKYDPGFMKSIEWDIPLLDGYDYQFLKNVASDPGSHHFYGIINPDILTDIQKIKPDVLLVYGWAYHSHLKAIRYFKNKMPIWFRGDSTLLDKQPVWKDFIRAFFLRKVYRKISKVFYPGSASKAYFLKYGIKEDQLHFAPHAVNNEHFAKEHAEAVSILREKLNVKHTDILLLFAGKFEKKKNPLALIDAFIEIARPEFHLLIVGDGTLNSEIKKRVENNSQIHIHSFVNQSDIPVFYQACNLFCLPSSGPGETWGLAVNEAMAAGKAVLVSDKAGSAYNLVQAHQNGLVFNPDKMSNLKESLEYLLSDKDRLERMGKKSMEIIKDYSFNNQVTEIIKNLPGQSDV